MSYHILTLQTPGSKLNVDRGFIVCNTPHQPDRRVALADVRMVVVAVPSVSFSNECIARLMAQDSAILHCDRHFKPIGWSMPLQRVIRQEVFANEIRQDKTMNHTLWQALCLQKMKNQAYHLDLLGIDHSLHLLAKRTLPSESNVARQYWRHLFGYLRSFNGESTRRERQGAKSFENKALNYGYAVLATLVHRAALMYGLLPTLGIHHDFRYRSTPLVYDLMEPARPWIDLLLTQWFKDQGDDAILFDEEDRFKSWIQALMQGLVRCRVKHMDMKHSFKLADAIDRMVATFATCHEDAYFKAKDTTPLFLPRLDCQYWHHGDSLNEEAEADDPEDL
ncbi:MAG: type II CRISPR-associated endonuclease Cas1 [Vampirovibrionales bacterium]|nr:type II CRISPR-associated endonuclease Cas1 [Vampirovibrionales bacterium]